MLKYTQTKISDYFVPKNLGKIDRNIEPIIPNTNVQTIAPSSSNISSNPNAGNIITPGVELTASNGINTSTDALASKKNHQWLYLLGAIALTAGVIYLIYHFNKPEEDENRDK